MITQEEKSLWVDKTWATPLCKLNGKEASLYGENLDFCVVCRRDGRGEIVIAWENAIRIINERGGEFVNDDNQEILRKVAEGRKEVPQTDHVTIRHKSAKKK